MIKEETPVILIINFHSTKNAGDLALLQSVINQMKNAFGSPRIFVSANYPDEQGFTNLDVEVIPSIWSLSGINKRKVVIWQIIKVILNSLIIFVSTKEKKNGNILPKNGLKRLLAAYQIADLVVGTSGNQFYSTGKFGWPFPVNILSVALCHKFKKPLYVMPQSIGPLRRWWEKILLRLVYRGARKVYLRDKLSLSVAKDLGIPENILEYSPDPAFSFQAAPENIAKCTLEKYHVLEGLPALGLTVISPMGHSLEYDQVNNYYSILIEVLKRFLETYSAQVVIFNQVVGPSVFEDDSIAALTIHKELRIYSEKVILIDEPLHPTILKACYGLMDAFIASRLHSGIFSLGMYVPTLFIGYLSKTKAILDSIGLEDDCLEISKLTYDTFLEQIIMLWENQEDRTNTLRRIMPIIITESKKPQEWISMDYFNVKRI